MKNIIRSLIIVTLVRVCWADMYEPAAAQPQAPSNTVKHRATTVTAVSAITAASAATAAPAATAVPAGTAASAIAAVSAVMPAPVRTALDEAVMETNALSPLLNVPSPSASVPSAPPSPEKGEGESQTLRGLFGQWVKSDEPTFDPEVSGGVAMMRVGGQTNTAPEIALRFKPSPPAPLPAEGEGMPAATDSSLMRASPRSSWGGQRPGEGWALEIAGILPHQVSGAFDTASQSVGSTAYQAQLSSFYEIHVAGVHALPGGNQDWAVPEIGLGLSLTHMTDNIQSVTPATYSFQSGGQTYTYTDNVWQEGTAEIWSLSPYLHLGVVLFPKSLLSIRLGVAYAGYSNTAHGLGQTFDLGLTGVTFEEMLQLRL
jgi:hypothetical protein